MPLFPSAASISSSSSSRSKNDDDPISQRLHATDSSWLNIGSSYQQPLVGSVPDSNADHSLLCSVADSRRSEEPSKKKRKHKSEQRTRSDKEHKKKKDKHSSKKKKHRHSDHDVPKDVIKDDDNGDYSSSDWSSDDEPLHTASAAAASSSSSSSSSSSAVHRDRDRRKDRHDRIHSSAEQQVVVHDKPTATAALPRDVLFLPDGRILLTAPKQAKTEAPIEELYRIDRRADKDLLTFGHYRLDIPNYTLSTDRGIRPLAQLVKHSHQLPRFHPYSSPDEIR